MGLARKAFSARGVQSKLNERPLVQSLQAGRATTASVCSVRTAIASVCTTTALKGFQMESASAGNDKTEDVTSCWIHYFKCPQNFSPEVEC